MATLNHHYQDQGQPESAAGGKAILGVTGEVGMKVIILVVTVVGVVVGDIRTKGDIKEEVVGGIEVVSEEAVEVEEMACMVGEEEVVLVEVVVEEAILDR